MFNTERKKLEIETQLKSFITNVESGRFDGALDKKGEPLSAEKCRSRAERAKAILQHLESITVEKFEKIAFATEILVDDLVEL